ncbi:hypothetical protein QPI79_002213 [Enterococcus faecalis]|nr:hypothetical protein [Enterococcus faecalis]
MAQNNNFSRFSGNRFSLRAKSSDQIKRLDSLSNSLGAVGDILVSTWGGIIMGILTLGLGGFLIFRAVTANNMSTLVQNIVPIIFILIGSILIALNVIMTNPSMGSQFFVSFKFVVSKIKKNTDSGKTVDFKPYRFYKNDPQKSIIEAVYKGKLRYLAIYRVRGAVSPVTFEKDLELLASLDRQSLTNMEKDSLLTTINSVQATKVSPKQLPKNATSSMIKRRDMRYNITANLPYNQQLKTIVIVVAPTPDILRVRSESLENSFSKGLVIGYLRLCGADAQKEINDIYGEMSTETKRYFI